MAEFWIFLNTFWGSWTKERQDSNMPESMFPGLGLDEALLGVATSSWVPSESSDVVVACRVLRLLASSDES